MPDIPSKEPAIIYAGETVVWTKSLPDYPASTYTLKYYLNGPAAIVLTAAAYLTTDHKVTVNSAGAGGSSGWAYGVYTWQCFAEKGTGDAIEKYLVGSGSLTVKTGTGKSHIKATLDAIEALMEGRSVSDVENYNVGGRSLTKMSVADLIKWRSTYKIEYQRELDAENVAKGLDSSRRVGVRFRRL